MMFSLRGGMCEASGFLSVTGCDMSRIQILILKLFIVNPLGPIVQNCTMTLTFSEMLVLHPTALKFRL